jgi:hypothetical protein
MFLYLDGDIHPQRNAEDCRIVTVVLLRIRMINGFYRLLRVIYKCATVFVISCDFTWAFRKITAATLWFNRFHL